MKLILIGMPRTGKSTVGELVSKKLALPFFDTDKVIQESYGRIRDHAFREAEKVIFTELVKKEKCVIATGGGTPLYVPHFEKLTTNSKVIFLYSHWDVIWSRIEREQTLPAFLDPQNPCHSFKELYRARLIHYLRFAHRRINTMGLSLEEVSQLVTASLV